MENHETTNFVDVYIKEEVEVDNENGSILVEAEKNTNNHYLYFNDQDSLDNFEEDKKDTGFSWTKPRIQLMLSIIQENKYKFWSLAHKSEIFRKVLKEFQDRGINDLRLDAIAKKWGNMLTTYRRNNFRSRKYGVKTVTWEYYEVLNDIIRNPKGIRPPPHIPPTALSSIILPTADNVAPGIVLRSFPYTTKMAAGTAQLIQVNSAGQPETSQDTPTLPIQPTTLPVQTSTQPQSTLTTLPTTPGGFARDGCRPQSQNPSPTTPVPEEVPVSASSDLAFTAGTTSTPKRKKEVEDMVTMMKKTNNTVADKCDKRHQEIISVFTQSDNRDRTRHQELIDLLNKIESNQERRHEELLKAQEKQHQELIKVLSTVIKQSCDKVNGM